MLRRGSFVFVLLLNVVVTGNALAQGIVFPSTGAKHRSMAGASTAAPLDAAGATHWNPAAMAGLEESEIFIGVDFMYADTFLDARVEATNEFGSNRSDSGLAAFPAIAIASRPENSGYTWGLNLRSIVGRTIDFPGSEFNPILKPFNPPSSAGVGPVGSRLSGLQIDPMMSIDLSEKFSVGFGGMVTSMHLAADPAFFATRNADGLFPPATQGRPRWGFGFQGGVLYRPNDAMSVGASYKTKQWFETFEYNSKDAIGNARDLSFELELPAILSLGLGYYGVEDTTIAFDIRHFAYDNTKGFGGDRLQWNSIWAFAVGFERTLNDSFKVSGGFSHNGNPIPSSATLANIQFPAINKTAIAIGTSFALTQKVDLVGSVYYAFPHTNTGTILEIPGSTVELRQELTTISLGFSFEL